jgi:hypothetical protein
MWEGDMMKTAIKAMMLGVAACAFAAPAFAYTLTGTIPGGVQGKPSKSVAIQLQKPPSTKGFLKLTVSSPPVNANVPYTVTFCVDFASAAYPCSTGTTAALSLVVPGQQAVVFIPTYIYPKEVIWIGHGTAVAVPYIVDVDYIP